MNIQRKNNGIILMESQYGEEELIAHIVNKKIFPNTILIIKFNEVEKR